MELTEKIESLNNQLIDLYGIDTITGMPIWRISWSDSQLEKRKMDTTPGGVQLLYPQVFEVPKYPYIKERYILERLVVLVNSGELTSKLTYEPMWTFQKGDGSYLPPILPAINFIIDCVHAAIKEDGGMAKYIESDDELSEEGKQARVQKLQEELFGNETETCDALRYNEGIVVPRNYTKEN